MSKPSDIAASWLLGSRFPRIAIWAGVALAIGTNAAYDLLQSLLIKLGLPGFWPKAIILAFFASLLYVLYLRFLDISRSSYQAPTPHEEAYLINFAHPITELQITQVSQMLGSSPQIITVPTQVARSRPLDQVARELVDAVQLSPAQWAGVPVVVNPPGLAPVALAVIAEIHGRSGYFPSILHIRPRTVLNEQGEEVNLTPPEYIVGEISNLQAIRDQSRTRR